MKYTKEKWEVIEGDEDFIVTDESGNTLCLVPFYKEGEANAHLMAAAPLLYEALKGILLVAQPCDGAGFEFEKTYSGVFSVNGNRLEKAVEALAKAERKS